MLSQDRCEPTLGKETKLRNTLDPVIAIKASQYNNDNNQVKTLQKNIFTIP